MSDGTALLCNNRAFGAELNRALLGTVAALPRLRTAATVEPVR